MRDSLQCMLGAPKGATECLAPEPISDFGSNGGLYIEEHPQHREEEYTKEKKG
jgi:hypothetical protein